MILGFKLGNRETRCLSIFCFYLICIIIIISCKNKNANSQKNKGNLQIISLIWTIDAAECEKCRISLASAYYALKGIGLSNTLVVKNISEELLPTFEKRLGGLSFDSIITDDKGGNRFLFAESLYILQGNQLVDSFDLSTSNIEQVRASLAKFFVRGTSLVNISALRDTGLVFEKLSSAKGVNASKYMILDEILNDLYYDRGKIQIGETKTGYAKICEKLEHCGQLTGNINFLESYDKLVSLGISPVSFDNIMDFGNEYGIICKVKLAIGETINAFYTAVFFDNGVFRDTVPIKLPPKSSLNFANGLHIDQHTGYFSISYLNGVKATDRLRIGKFARSDNAYVLDSVIETALPSELLDLNVNLNSLVIFKKCNNILVIGMKYYPFVKIIKFDGSAHTKWQLINKRVMIESNFIDVHTYLLIDVNYESNQMVELVYWEKGKIVCEYVNLDDRSKTESYNIRLPDDNFGNLKYIGNINDGQLFLFRTDSNYLIQHCYYLP